MCLCLQRFARGWASAPRAHSRPIQSATMICQVYANFARSAPPRTPPRRMCCIGAAAKSGITYKEDVAALPSKIAASNSA